MRAGYKVENNTNVNDTFIIVANYWETNKVCLYGFENIEQVENNTCKKYDVGLWRIKRK